MKVIQVVSGPASINANAVAQTPSAMIPSIGVALRLISANRRTIALEWLGIAAGPERDRHRSARLSVVESLRRRAGAPSGSGLTQLPLPPRCAPTSRIAAQHV